MPQIPEPRIKETTTGTGTGTLDLDGAVSPFRQVRAGYADTTSEIPYVIADASGGYEIGFGTISYGTGAGGKDQLARNTIWRSSNGGAAVNWGAGTKDVFVAIVPNGILLPANNLSDVASAATSRTNLGLGTAAVETLANIVNKVLINGASAGRLVVPVGVDKWAT